MKRVPQARRVAAGNGRAAALGMGLGRAASPSPMSWATTMPIRRPRRITRKSKDSDDRHRERQRSRHAGHLRDGEGIRRLVRSVHDDRSRFGRRLVAVRQCRPWIAGGFVWTGFDYRGEPSPYQWPNISSQYGVIDTCGFPKDTFYYYQSWWTEKPVLHVFPHWNWPGLEGKEIAVWVHSNLDRVELFHNGQSLGAKEDVPRTRTWPGT